MIQIIAPFETNQTGIVLPNPEPEDRVGNLLKINARRTMNNTLYTYVQDTGRIQLTYKMRLFRAKALELRAFCEAYLMSNLRLVDYGGVQYRVVLTNDPFEFTPVSREEMTEVALTFEGVAL